MKPLTRAEQRVKWLESQYHRPLTEAEADELYISLKQIEYRERRIARLEEEQSDALKEYRIEEDRILERVIRESRKPDPRSPKPPMTFEQVLEAVGEGRAKIIVMPPRPRKAEEFTLGGVSSGWAA
jgi:hypothetical protein